MGDERLAKLQFFRHTFFGAGSVTIACWVLTSDGHAVPSKDALLSAWKNRELISSSVVIKWDENRDFSARAASQMDDGVSSKVRARVEAATLSVRLILGTAGRVRLETFDARSGVGGYGKFRVTTAFDGKGNTFYSEPQSWDGIGSIDSSQEFIDAWNYEVRAPLLAYRPFMSGIYREDPECWNMVAEDQPMGDLRLAVFRYLPSTVSEVVTEIWVDPNRQYLPVRVIERLNNVSNAQWNLDYRSENGGVDVLSAWEALLLSDDGKLFQAARAKNVSLQFNVPISDSEFVVQFPSGTRVRDKRNGSMYFIKDDGSHLSLSDWGQAIEFPSRWSRVRVFLLALNLLGVIVLVFLVFRRWSWANSS